MKFKNVLFLGFSIILTVPVHASFIQECKGFITLLSPLDSPNDGWLNAHFLMHKETFVCTGGKGDKGDSTIPKITGYRHETLQYTGLDIGIPKKGDHLRVSYHLSKGVTLGGGGHLNWVIKAPVNPTLISKKEKKLINKEFAKLTKLTYLGSYFSIDYPKDFSVTIEKPVDYDAAGDANFDPYDEAYFTSPDQQVEFYVFSPLWGGKPQSYLDVASNEELIGEQTTKDLDTDPYRDKNRDLLLTRRATVKAKNGSYFKSYVQTKKRSSDFTRKVVDLDLVFGIKYKNQKSYEKYRDAYLAFKKSLIQLSDH